MIKPKGFVHLLSAPSVIPGEHIKTIFIKGLCHAFYVSPVCIAFQTMRDNYNFVRILFEPVKVKKIIVSGGYPFLLIFLQCHPSRKRWVNCFMVLVE